MEIQELFDRMLTPNQRLRIQKTKEIANKYIEFKAYCEKNDVAVNTEGFCRVMGEEYNYSSLAVRRILERAGVYKFTKRDDNGKSSEDTRQDPAIGKVQAFDGSTVDGNSEMHSLQVH